MSQLVSVTAATGLVETIIHLRAMLARPATFDGLLDDTFEGTNTHASLAVSGESIMPGEGVAAETRVWLGAGMDLGMSLQVVTSNEALVAVVAFELTITKMSLDVGLDVLLAAETLIAVFVFANPLVV